MKKAHLIHRASINAKISVVFILLIAFLITFSNIALFLVFHNIFRRQIIKDLDNVMTQSSWNMNMLINGMNQAALYLCTDKSIASIINTNYKNAVNLSYVINDLNTVYSYHVYIPLNDVLQSYKSMFFVTSGFPISNKLNATESLENSGIFCATDVSSNLWYKEARHMKGMLYPFFIDNKRDYSDGKNTMYVARSVSNIYLRGRHSENGFMGVEVFCINLTEIGNKIQTGKLTPHTMVFLTDDRGTIFYSRNEKDRQTNISRYIPHSALKGYAGSTTVNITYGGQSYIASVNEIEYGWHLIALIPEHDITMRMSSLPHIILMTAVLALLLGIVISLFFSKTITQPIIKLAMVMESVKSKEYFDLIVNSPSLDEVGVLYDSFNDMMQRINRLVNELIKSYGLKRKAELKALQAQINPHFLYNALDAVNWLALSDGHEEIATITSSLANIMRFNLKDPVKFVTFEEEIQNVKNYVLIQSLRYKGDFHIVYHISQETLTLKIPKLTLQPLVENSIIHGTANADRNVEITVSGDVWDGIFVLTVTDDGIGTDPDILNAYLDEAAPTLKKESPDSYGIKNVHQRIRIHFGIPYGLRFYANQPYGITAVVTLPLGQPDDSDNNTG